MSLSLSSDGAFFQLATPIYLSDICTAVKPLSSRRIYELNAKCPSWTWKWRTSGGLLALCLASYGGAKKMPGPTAALCNFIEGTDSSLWHIAGAADHYRHLTTYNRIIAAPSPANSYLTDGTMRIFICRLFNLDKDTPKAIVLPLCTNSSYSVLSRGDRGDVPVQHLWAQWQITTSSGTWWRATNGRTDAAHQLTSFDLVCIVQSLTLEENALYVIWKICFDLTVNWTAWAVNEIFIRPITDGKGEAAPFPYTTFLPIQVMSR